MAFNGILEAFVEFLKNGNGRCTLQAQKTGIQFFRTFPCNSRTRVPSVNEDVVCLIASLLDSELKMEVLLIFHELLQQPSCRKSHLMASVLAPSLIGGLDTGDTECLELALKMICELSSDNDIKLLVISSGIIAQLSPILSEVNLTKCCLKILRNLCKTKEAVDLIIRTDHCLGSISNHLDRGSRKEQEHVSVILLTVSSCSVVDHVLVMKEGALGDLSVNETVVAKASSIKLLELLRDLRAVHAVGGVVESSSRGSICKQPISKSPRYISRKLNLCSKPRSLTLV